MSPDFNLYVSGVYYKYPDPEGRGTYKTDVNGKTWEKSYKIDGVDDDSKKDYTAYSDLVKLSQNKIGVLYEKDNYKEIVFTVVKWK